MTTITVKIVSQLTGDTEFASPETLVAFALLTATSGVSAAPAEPSTKAAPAEKAEPAAKNASTKAKPVLVKTQVAPVVTAVPELQPKSNAKPLQGSPEWAAYCKKKYVSFNEAKGSYLSKTGIERKCLVTAD